MFCQLSQCYVVKFRRQNQNIFQKVHFRKFSENLFCWAYQVDIRDLKKSHNSIAINGLLNIRPYYLVFTYLCSMKISFLSTHAVHILVHTDFLVFAICIYLLLLLSVSYSYFRIIYLFLSRRGGTFDACRRCRVLIST